MRPHLTAAALVAALLCAGCSENGDDDAAPDALPTTTTTAPAPSSSSQDLAPAAAPTGWTRATVGPVTVSTPADWARQPTTRPAPNLESTSWRAPEVEGASPAGLTVRVITSPQQPARQAALALSISAMAELGARDVEPEELSWPGADEAQYLAYASQVPTGSAPGAERRPYETRTLVLDLEDGSQVQVTAIADEASGGGDLAEQALAAVTLG